MKSYRDLVAWQRAMDSDASTYRLTQSFPDSKRFGLTSQARRAAVSIVANIAEGHGRDSTAEFLHHLSYSLGSLAELETHLTIALRLGYLSQLQLDPLLSDLNELGRIIRGLQQSLQRTTRAKS